MGEPVCGAQRTAAATEAAPAVRHPVGPSLRGDVGGCVPGRVHLVGAGPGAEDLLTVRAVRLLATADLVVHDQLVTDEVLEWASSCAEVVPVGRRQGRVLVSHEEVIGMLVAAAHRGRRVVRLKGGDPVVLGRGGEEALDLARHGIVSELVPGVTSAIAAPELAGIPVTHRGVAPGFLVVTAAREAGRADGDEVDWQAAGTFSGTVVVLMGTTRLAATCRRLREYGRAADTPAALVSHAGRASQRTVTATLATLPELAERAAVEAPAVLVVGEVVGVPGRVGQLLASHRAASA